MEKRYLIDTNVITKYFEETLSEQCLSLYNNKTLPVISNDWERSV